MSRRCDYCGKGSMTGNRISHAHNKTKMRQLPNLQVVHVVEKGRAITRRLCTRCIKTGRYVKSA